MLSRLPASTALPAESPLITRICRSESRRTRTPGPEVFFTSTPARSLPPGEAVELSSPSPSATAPAKRLSSSADAMRTTSLNRGSQTSLTVGTPSKSAHHDASQLPDVIGHVGSTRLGAVWVYADEAPRLVVDPGDDDRRANSACELHAPPYLVDVAGQAATPDVDRAHVKLVEALRELLLVPGGGMPDAERAGERRSHVGVDREERDLGIDLGDVVAQVARQVLDQAGPGDSRVRVQEVLPWLAQRHRVAGVGDQRAGHALGERRAGRMPRGERRAGRMPRGGRR